MEAVFIGIAIFIVVLFIFIQGVLEERKLRRYQMKKLRELYGHKTTKNLSTERLNHIRNSSKYYKEETAIDQITWNDLDMDKVFARIDYTASAVAEEALCHMLCVPLLEEQELNKRNHHINFYLNSEEERLKSFERMQRFGYYGKYTIYDYLNYLSGEQKSFLGTILLDILMVVFLILGVSFKLVFLLPMACIMFFQGIMYYQKKSKLESYLSTFAMITRLLNISRHLQNNSNEFKEEFKEELNTIHDALKAFESFKRGSFLVFNDDSSANIDPFGLLKIILSYINMTFHFDLMKMNAMLVFMEDKKDDIVFLYETVGMIDAYNSVAYFKKSLSYYTEPEFREAKSSSDITYTVEELYHPLLDEFVANSFVQKRGMLLTGSNASGKSTFLKTVALNAVLSQTIFTSCSRKYEGNMYRVYSSMALRDSIENGDSYFVVEIKSMKRIFDAASKDGAPILCTIDEVLRGTNTIERIAASTELLRSLNEQNVLCFAATHDIELTKLLETEFDNYHFTEIIKEQNVDFPYKLFDGPATSRNAIKLMEMLGFDINIINKARILAGGNINGS